VEGRWVDGWFQTHPGRWQKDGGGSKAASEREGSGVGSRHTPGSRLDAREVWWLEGGVEGGEW